MTQVNTPIIAITPHRFLLGRIDIVMNSAGAALLRAAIDKSTPDHWEAITVFGSDDEHKAQRIVIRRDQGGDKTQWLFLFHQGSSEATIIVGESFAMTLISMVSESEDWNETIENSVIDREGVEYTLSVMVAEPASIRQRPQPAPLTPQQETLKAIAMKQRHAYFGDNPGIRKTVKARRSMIRESIVIPTEEDQPQSESMPEAPMIAIQKDTDGNSTISANRVGLITLRDTAQEVLDKALIYYSNLTKPAFKDVRKSTQITDNGKDFRAVTVIIAGLNDAHYLCVIGDEQERQLVASTSTAKQLIDAIDRALAGEQVVETFTDFDDETYESFFIAVKIELVGEKSNDYNP